MITGIVVALPQELDTLTTRKIVKGDVISLSKNLFLAYSGAGADNAQIAAKKLVEQGAMQLMSWGCAAALSPNLQSGDLLLTNRLITAEGATLDIDSDWFRHVHRVLEKLACQANFALRSGALLESKQLVAKSSEKQQLYQQKKALALDMESIAIAKVAQQHGLAFLAIRAIADPVHMNLPQAVSYALNAQGDVQIGKLLLFLLSHPFELSGLIALGKQFSSAKQTLKSVAQLLEQLITL